MSNLEEHEAEQAAITAACEAGKCDHAECQPPRWDVAAREVFDGAIRNDMNDERAARVVLACYPSYDDDTLETMVCDLLGDLRHLCDLMGWDFAALDKGSHLTYSRELHESGGVAKNERLRSAFENSLQ